MKEIMGRGETDIASIFLFLAGNDFDKPSSVKKNEEAQYILILNG